MPETPTAAIDIERVIETLGVSVIEQYPVSDDSDEEMGSLLTLSDTYALFITETDMTFQRPGVIITTPIAGLEPEFAPNAVRFSGDEPCVRLLSLYKDHFFLNYSEHDASKNVNSIVLLSSEKEIDTSLPPGQGSPDSKFVKSVAKRLNASITPAHEKDFGEGSELITPTERSLYVYEHGLGFSGERVAVVFHEGILQMRRYKNGVVFDSGSSAQPVDSRYISIDQRGIIFTYTSHLARHRGREQ